MIRYNLFVLRVVVKFYYLWCLCFSVLFLSAPLLLVILQPKLKEKPLPPGYTFDPDWYCYPVGSESFDIL